MPKTPGPPKLPGMPPIRMARGRVSRSATATPASLAPDHHAQFIDLLQSSLDQNAFIKLVLAKYVGEEAELQRIIIKPVTVK